MDLQLKITQAKSIDRRRIATLPPQKNYCADQMPTKKIGIDRSGSVSNDRFLDMTKALPLLKRQGFPCGCRGRI